MITAALIAGMVGCGPISQNLEIWTWYDLDDVRDNLGGNHILMNDLDSTTAGYEELASPIANGGKGWQSIYAFRGTLDGQGHEICDLFINRSDQNREGLFSLLYRGVIKNIGVVNVTAIGWGYVGGLVGENDQGTINNSYCTGTVTGHYQVGGLVGSNWGTVSNSYFIGNVTSDGPYVGGLVGWISSSSTVSNSYYDYDEVLINGENVITIGALFAEDFDEWLANNQSLDVNARLSQENDYYVVNNVSDFKELLAFGQDGSLKFRLKNDLDLVGVPNFYIPYLAGEFDGNGHKISNLSFSFDFVSHVGLFGHLASGGKVTDLGAENVNITGDNSDDISGLVGYNLGTVSNSYSSGNVTGDYWVGGLVGYNLGTVSNSYSSGNVTGDYWVGGLVGWNAEGTVSNSCSTGKVSGDRVVGGLVGDNRGIVSNSYSTSSVTGDGTVGGLVGKNFHGTVSNSYSTGSVTDNGDVCGLVGENEGTVRNSFWDIQTSGQSTSDGGTGKTTAQMKNIATFSGAGWDIIAVALNETNPSYIWNIVNNVTYPFLSWQPA